MHPTPSLPIEQVLAALRDALRNGGGAVLQAPPGAGKTTGVPLALLMEPWVKGRGIVMLEPRRLAARAAARRMATMLGERPGETVGYRVRHESVVGPATRIVVVTEGVLTRMLQSDPGLERFALVIFDEFHERSIHADLGLALTIHARSLLREDLRILVMSATLDGGAVSGILGGVPVVTSEGRLHPVDIRHRARRFGTRLEPQVAAVTREALEREQGDVLVFLPGTGEIRRVAALLSDVDADVIPLHGNLSPEQQDRAVLPSTAAGARKVVLATSIAETSLTIEGVRVVVDSGLSRVPRYSPKTGMTRLATVRVSLTSAEQRRGRAGRLGPGVCYRLWSVQEHAALPARANPEILEADLAPLALDLAAVGVPHPAELSWLDPPPPAAFARARALLGQLGAVDASGRLTRHGGAMARLALHPRLSHMVLKATELRERSLACDLAALLTERDLLRRSDGVPEADIRTRLDLLRGTVVRTGVDREALRRARAEAALCRRAGRARDAEGEDSGVGRLLAMAYPDRVAQLRSGTTGRFLLRNGLGAFLDPHSLSGEEYLVVCELDGRAPESRILLAAPISLEDLRELFEAAIEVEEVVAWESESRAVRSSRRERLGAIVLREVRISNPDPDRVAEALIQGVRGEGLHVLPWSEGARRTRERISFVRTLEPGWPDVSDAALMGTLEQWLGPHIQGLSKLSDLEHVDLGAALLDRLAREQRAVLERLAPTHLVVPSGSRLPLDYRDPAQPVLAVRVQEMFGQTQTPRVGGGKVPVTLHLLSPAGRPVQVTRDLAGFWRTTYFEVRKDLKGRYPRHPWPDDPSVAEPTKRVRKAR
jgi:ATP-dependent helicase HrpB